MIIALLRKIASGLMMLFLVIGSLCGAAAGKMMVENHRGKNAQIGLLVGLGCWVLAALMAWLSVLKKKKENFREVPVQSGEPDVMSGNNDSHHFPKEEARADMNDDAFYDEVAKELEANKLIPGVWTRAFAEADGNENRAKAIYIKQRVAQLVEICRQQLEEAKQTAMQTVADTKAASWEVVNDRWVKNIYANGDITMSDKDTGRMWLYSASLCWKNPWAAAMAYCDNLTYAGYSDWRLPDKDTLKAQFSQKGFFAGVQGNAYWSGTSGASTTDDAWFVDMVSDYVGKGDKVSSHYVWPVRGGQ
jgi:hypothetical protein